jgi:hypothetical protein
MTGESHIKTLPVLLSDWLDLNPHTFSEIVEMGARSRDDVVALMTQMIDRNLLRINLERKGAGIIEYSLTVRDFFTGQYKKLGNDVREVF